MKWGLRPTGLPSRTPARWDGKARIVQHALLVVLILATTAPSAFSQSIVCHPIRRGESATQAARRVTGDARNTYQASFQIMNASSRFIPKSQYARIRPGWQACVTVPAVSDSSSNAPGLTTSDAPETPDASDPFDGFGTGAAPAPRTTVDVIDGQQSAASNLLRRVGRVDLAMVWLAAMVVPWFGWRILDDHLDRRRTTAIVVRHFALRFVDEFERPLVRNRVSEPPVRSRLRTSVRWGRFDLLLAPGTGRHYPNLSDHRQNVEYDVARVMQTLPDDVFVRGPLSTDAEWVVVPLQCKAGPRQSGVTCISSL